MIIIKLLLLLHYINITIQLTIYNKYNYNYNNYISNNIKYNNINSNVIYSKKLSLYSNKYNNNILKEGLIQIKV